jgi:hypothetical protein
MPEKEVSKCPRTEPGQATRCGLGPISGRRVPALDVGPKNDLTTDCSKSPLEEEIFCNSPCTTLSRFLMNTNYSLDHL